MTWSQVDPKIIESIPSVLLKTLPAGQPPRGIQPSFADPPTRIPVILGVCTAFIVLAVICFTIRIYTKLVISKKWKWDDVTCSLGFICSIVHFGAVVMGCTYGPYGKHIWDIHLDRVMNKSQSEQIYIAWITITPALGLIKFSLFLQYYFLFRPLRWIRISVWTGGTVSAVFYVAVTIIACVLDSPWPGESLQEALLSRHAFVWAQFAIPIGVVGMLVDWYLLILPIPAIWNLQVSPSKKLGVLIIFMTGGLAAIASIMSLNYRVYLEKNISDPTWNVSYVLLWAQVEMFAGVAASSMPTVHQFFVLYKVSSRAKWSSLKSILMKSRFSSTKVKIRDCDPSLNSTEYSRAARKPDLEANGHERETPP